MFAQTDRTQLVDAQGRPYFLWDMDMTLAEFEQKLAEGEPSVRAYLIGKVMRQAKPDDALQFVTPQEMADAWPEVERYLGQTREFWMWLIGEWRERGVIGR